MLGYDLAVLARPDGERRMANVRKLMRMARSFEEAEGRDLRGFLDHLDDRAAAAEGEAAVAAEGREVVRIMTVHAAKGLEFPVVAFADLGRRLLDGAFPPVLRVGRSEPGGLVLDEIEAEEEEAAAAAQRVGVRMARLGAKRRPIYDYQRLQDEADEEGEREGLRLAHVAVTRAARHLILSGRVVPSALKKGDVKHGTPVLERLLGAWGIELPAADDEEPDTEGGIDESEIEIAAPEPRPGLEAEPFEPARLAIRIARPGPAWAAAVRREVPVPPGPAERAIETPLLGAIESEPPAAAPAHLSYTAISEYERCGLRFYLERVLGLPRDDLFPGSGASEGAVQLGNAVHELLERSGGAGWAAPDPERVVEALRRNGCGAGPPQVEEIGALLGAWLEGPTLAALRGEEAAVRPELPFGLAVGGTVVRGAIDLIAERSGKPPLVVDYKTNRLDATTPEQIVASEYEPQRDIYALAAAAGTGAETVETAYAFLRSDEPPVTKAYDGAELERARERIESLVARVRGGEFHATEPGERVCTACPGRLRLCPRWKRDDDGELVPAPGDDARTA